MGQTSSQCFLTCSLGDSNICYAKTFCAEFLKKVLSEQQLIIASLVAELFKNERNSKQRRC